MPVTIPAGHTLGKLVVVLHHDAKRGVALCMKATSQTTIYHTNKAKRAGCVMYAANEVKCFGKETVIQPDNLLPIPYRVINEHCVVGQMPEDFRPRLVQAITNSIEIAETRKKQLLQLAMQEG